MAAYPEHLLDLADAAHAARVAGYSEAQIARAAGFPELADLAQRVSSTGFEDHADHP
jgi:hypothetical protein